MRARDLPEDLVLAGCVSTSTLTNELSKHKHSVLRAHTPWQNNDVQKSVAFYKGQKHQLKNKKHYNMLLASILHMGPYGFTKSTSSPNANSPQKQT